MTANFQRQYTAREKVLHKLAGAAYQMTFEADGEDAPEYDQAAATMAMAVEFWGNSADVESYWDLEHSLDPTTLFDTPAENGDGVVSGIESTTKKEYLEAHSTDESTPDMTDYVDAQDITVPGPGTQSRDAVLALLRANRDGVDWAAPADLREYGGSSGAVNQISALRQHYDWVQWSKADGLGNEYRVDPDRRDAVWAAIRADGGDSEGATA